MADEKRQEHKQAESRPEELLVNQRTIDLLVANIIPTTKCISKVALISCRTR
ncbi:MAG: hypothetical protein RBS57_04225 [Desulforhabdus sp.]|jgi:hypothetical protein|nr:hypothetical protein [Desulforhabdus sp.]